MRSVSRSTGRGVAVLVLLAVFACFTVYADEPSPFDPPQNRILPPPGVAASTEQPRSFFDDFWLWIQLQNRISPPIG
jgi:hypothetical protein